MAAPDLESRILELAQLRGWLSKEELDQAAFQSNDRDRLAFLIQRGLLKSEVVEVLAAELMRTHLFTQISWQPDCEDIEPPPEHFSTWRKYERLESVGMNADGLRYRAKDPHLDRWVLLRFPIRDEPMEASRMLLGARAQAGVDHPNIAKIYEVGVHEGQPFIAMQWIQGPRLSEIRNRLSISQKITIVQKLGEGLEAAHQQGLVGIHMRIDNIQLELTDPDKPHPYLLDLGLTFDERWDLPTIEKTFSEATESMLWIGGPSPFDPRMDLESLGQILCFLLTGTIHVPEQAPGLPIELANIIDACCRKDLNERYPSARALIDDLERFLHHRPIQAHPRTLIYLGRKWMRRNRLSASLTGCALALLATLGIWHWRSLRRAQAQILLAENYVREVQNTGHLLRLSNLSRIHDRRPTVALLQETMAWIRSDMLKMGSDAAGPGQYALGEGHWALGEIGAAENCLDQAWESGFRSPACAQLRGLVLATRYLRERLQASAEDPATRSKHLKQLDTLQRAPALECFRIARDAGLNSPYLEAMAAYLNGDSPHAIALTQNRDRSDPGRYELDLLGYTLLMEQSNALRAQGKDMEATTALKEAGRSLGMAIEAAPSDPVLWEKQGWWCFTCADQPGVPQQEQMEWVKRAQVAFNNCITVDPDRYPGLGALAQVCRRLADFAKAQGKDPMPFLDQGVEYARTAAQKILPPDKSTTLAWALIARSRERLLQGQDANQDLDLAIAELSKCLEISRDYDALSGMETACYLRGQSAFQKGEDPLPHLHQAVRWAEVAQQVEQAFPLQPIGTLGRRVSLLEMELILKRTPSESPQELIQGLESELRKHPQEPSALIGLSRALYVAAYHEAATNQNPQSTFEACHRLLETTLKVSPDDVEARILLGEWGVSYGAWLKKNALPCNSVVRQSLAIIEPARKRHPRYLRFKKLEAELKAMLARAHDQPANAREIPST